MSYTVADEFIVLREGAAVHYSDVGSTVELSDAEAAELIEAGKIVPHAIVTVDGVEVPPSGIGTHPDDSGPGEVELADGTRYDDVVPVPDEKPARSRRGGDSSES
ncbi:hypothetical protein [Mycolicibacterium fortuitum]|uniref:hypothetical protein n=1 Tax=Mycolicibacterium fortuitum TaxID=1766 RepID=UPI00096C9F7D|nr:hypothetical protein [Mycolicibacterium fortuitum]OMC02172.1 hypothetical protein A5734_15010 [Mycolicibacterium fortuitum]